MGRRHAEHRAGPTGGAGSAADGRGAVDPRVDPGVLYVVATPIGNLSDVTLRALEVLRAVPLIAAEDTRITKRLLDRHGIDNRLVSYHARSGPARLTQLLDHLRSGTDLALVTDAGTPGISDPGDDLVAAWAAEGGRVVPVPGASAVLAAITASGMAGPRWGFEGFLPRSGRERRERLERIGRDDRATVVYESPGRLGKTLADLVGACGPTRSAAVCRELTKIHEQVVRGSLAEVGAAVSDGRFPARGEVVIVVGPGPAPAAPRAGGGDVVSETARADEERLAAARQRVAALVREGVARGDAARRASTESGIPRRRLYDGAPPRR